MAGQTIEVNVAVTDNGNSIKQRIKDTQELNAQLTKASSADAGSSKKSAARLKAESVDYGASRVLSGGTGAGARDFAQESQGLGGLVRLYATYAANVFAVGAAFSALRNAMNVDNMIQGMDQLGAASGTSLGALSKQFVEVAGNAISMRDSIEAVTKASSAGLSSKQIIQIAEVAKKASQALGISMTDAVSRLSRGITKLEPELLDELGLFTKIGPATENYAKSLGKTTAQLTDFEKRQGFALGVLKEGIDKFGDIDIPTNPYDKLLASLTNLGQNVAHVLNIAITPLVSILNSSPTALIAVVALLAKSIAERALPVLGQYNQGLKASAERAADVASAQAAAAKKSLKVQRDARAEEIKQQKGFAADQKIAAVDAAEEAVKAASKAGISKGVKTILAKPDIMTITPQDLKLLDDLGSKNTKVAETYRNLSAAIVAAQEADKNYFATVKKLKVEAAAPPSKLSPAGVAVSKAEKARQVAASKNIISMAGETAAVDGFWKSLSKTNEAVKESNMGTLRGIFTNVAAGASAAVTRIGGLLSAFSSLGTYGAIAGTIFATLDGIFSKNAHSVEEYNKVLDLQTETVKGAIATQKLYKGILSVEAILASTTALGNLTEGLDTVSQAFKKAQQDASWWDNIVDSVLSLFGKDLKTKFNDKYSEIISAAVSSISDPTQKKTYQASIMELLKIPDTSLENINKGAANATDEIKKKVKDLTDSALKDAKTISSPIQKVKDGFKELEKASLDVKNSLVNKDVGTTFGVALISQANNLTDAFKQTTSQVAVLKDILKNPAQIAFFPKDAQDSILNAARSLETLNKFQGNAKEEMTQGEGKVKAAGILQAAGNKEPWVEQLRLAGEAQLKNGKQLYDGTVTSISKINEDLKKGIKSAVAAAAELLEAPIVRASTQAAINAQKTILSALPKSSESITLTAKLEIQSIELRKEEIVQLRNLVRSSDLKRLQDERILLEDKKKTLPESDIKGREAIEKQLTSVRDQEKALNLGKDTKGITAAFSGGMSNEVAQIFAQEVGTITKLTELNGQQSDLKLRAALDIVANKFDREQQPQQQKLDRLLEENKLSRQDTGTMQPSELLAMVQEQTRKEQALKNQIQLAPFNKDIAVAGEAAGLGKGTAAGVVSEKELSLAIDRRDKLLQIQGVIEKTTDIEEKRALQAAAYTDSINLANRDTESLNIKLLASLNVQKLDNETTKAKLDLDIQAGKISQDDFVTKSLALDLSNAEIERQTKLVETQKTKTSELQAYQLLLIKAGGQENKDLASSKALILDKANVATQQVNDEYKQRTDLTKLQLDQQTELALKQKAYAGIIEQSVNNLTDAFINFAKTGKISFKDMANAIIADIARIEIRASMLKLLEGAGGTSSVGGGLMKLVGAGLNMFATGSSVPDYAYDLPTAASFSADALKAKGGAYDGGVLKFAKGGTFSNSVVNSPTMFKFAKGTGLMGEAGPEAIMPLKRDSNGSLGVVNHGGGSNVDVVVNNFSTTQATAKETVDSRGNRKIEVTVGEMVAGQLAVPGSAMQQTMSSAFGTKPVIARR